MALDSLAGEPAPSQRRVAIHERGDGLVEDDLCRRPASAWPAEMARDEFAVGRWARLQLDRMYVSCKLALWCQ